MDKKPEKDGIGQDAPAFEVKQRFWGCVVHRDRGPVVLVQLSEQIVLALGLVLMSGAMLVLQGSEPGPRPETGEILLSWALILAGLAVLRFGTGDAAIGLKIGSARRQVRDMVGGRVSHAGRRCRVLTDPSVSLHIERSGCDQVRALVLHHRGEREGLCLARGPERALRALRLRLSHDLRLDA